MVKKNILVLCTGNSCRSQLAEAYLRHFHGDVATIYSAGVETHGVNPKAVQTMLADGIDISTHTSNHVDEYLHIPFDLILTVCDHASERCPIFPGTAKRIHHNFADPAKATGSAQEIMEAFRSVREEIKSFCRELNIKLIH
jgi:arsenate reductase